MHLCTKNQNIYFFTMYKETTAKDFESFFDLEVLLMDTQKIPTYLKNQRSVSYLKCFTYFYLQLSTIFSMSYLNYFENFYH